MKARDAGVKMLHSAWKNYNFLKKITPIAFAGIVLKPLKSVNLK